MRSLSVCPCRWQRARSSSTPTPTSTCPSTPTASIRPMSPPTQHRRMQRGPHSQPQPCRVWVGDSCTTRPHHTCVSWPPVSPPPCSCTRLPARSPPTPCPPPPLEPSPTSTPFTPLTPAPTLGPALSTPVSHSSVLCVGQSQFCHSTVLCVGQSQHCVVCWSVTVLCCVLASHGAALCVDQLQSCVLCWSVTAL